jgi:DNA-binding MarR family transcriptional regulator
MISEAKAVEVQQIFSNLKRIGNWTTEKHARSALELSSTQARLLLYVAEHNGISQAQLATATNTDKALTGRVIEGLIERGWLKRSRSQEDARAYVLSMTAPGRKFTMQLQEIAAGITERLSHALDDRDVENLRRIAAKLTATSD